VYKIQIRNVNDAFIEGLYVLKAIANVEPSRNGLVKAAPCPVVTVYTHPWERVLFNEARDANPFFHLAECIWMLAGSNDVKWISQFNSNMGTFSDDGRTLHGAYGHRWREFFGEDQLAGVIRLLQKDPDSRRAVLAMWGAESDLGAVSKDIPCNTHIYLRIIHGKLEMTVCCRSNDMIWGAFGTNAVHFSFLQEWLAAALNCPPGHLYQFSNNFHIYERHWDWLSIPPSDGTRRLYQIEEVKWMPLVDRGETYQGFLLDCENIVMNHPPQTSRFLKTVAWPLLGLYIDRKGDQEIEPDLDKLPPVDWVFAAKKWVERRDASRPTRNYIDQG
jgi:hypothetical protein